jgi:hypothetical protein
MLTVLPASGPVMKRPSIALADALALSSIPNMREEMNSPKCPAVIGLPISSPILRSKSFREASNCASSASTSSSMPTGCRRSCRSGGAPVDQITECAGVSLGSARKRRSQRRLAERVVHG